MFFVNMFLKNYPPLEVNALHISEKWLLKHRIECEFIVLNLCFNLELFCLKIVRRNQHARTFLTGITQRYELSVTALCKDETTLHLEHASLKIFHYEMITRTITSNSNKAIQYWKQNMRCNIERVGEGEKRKIG